MDYKRHSDRYYDDYSPPRHHRGHGSVESTYSRDGVKDYQHSHRRHASDGGRSTYRDDYYELPPPPPLKDGDYYYEQVERRRRPAHSQRRPSYSAGPASRGRSSSRYSDERDLSRHHSRRGHSHHHQPHERKKSSSKNPLDGLDVNWKQAAEAAAGAAAAEAWRSRGNPDKMKRVATAAAGAVAVDLALGRGGAGDDKNKRHAMESAIGGPCLSTSGSAESDVQPKVAKEQGRQLAYCIATLAFLHGDLLVAMSARKS
ncbi:hypothetical protein PG993_009220 [Apiospora rasikravindrae]|uniref:Uncharacterized protein n=1 Tax=Apiospora rasikravindrae TaxID=990691 RepID=A0ABR1SIS4_9PEZI